MTDRGKLRWQKLEGPLEGEEAFSGTLSIGHFLYRTAEPRCWVYKIDAVSTKYIAKGNGQVASARSAKRAVENAWAIWLEEAGLE